MAQEIYKLTDASVNQSAFLPFVNTDGTPATISSSNGLSITFDFYAYGGSGGDGLSFYLVDGSQPLDKPGGFGGSLGYAPYSKDGIVQAGVVGGYLGIGLDAFGNYSLPIESRNGGSGFQPDSVAVRGSAATNYLYLGGQALPISLDNPTPGASRDSAKRTAQINLSPTGVLSVNVDVNGNGNFFDPGETIISNLDVVSLGNGAVPSNFRFAFAASTGEATNIHEVGNLSVKTFAGVPIPGSFSGKLTIINPDTNDKPTGGTGDDTIQAGGGNDQVTGQAGNDILVGGKGADAVTGGTGADRFVIAQGASKAEALKDSTLSSLDKIADFRQSEGDRFVLNYDNNLATIEKPKGLFNSGKEAGKNLKKALKSAYADKDQKKRGNQALKADEAMFFRLGNRTFLTVNDGKAAFSAKNDLLVDVTGIQFKAGDAKLGKLSAANYFVV